MATSLSQFSNWAELAMLNWAFTTLSMTGPSARPVQWFLGLSTTAPTSTGFGITEPVGSGYSRKGIVLLQAAGNPGQCFNTAQINFTASGGSWGNVAYGVIWDGLTLGNVWAFGPLANPKVIQDGDTIQFQPSTLAVGLI